MGGKKAQTIGYHYPWAWHLGWTRFADALLEVQAGGATAWQGRITDNTVLAINKPDLWGGEKGQGGMVGDLEVLFGGPAQAPSSYLTSTFGAKQSGNRGLVSTIWKGGRFGAFLANPKPVSMKFERIHAGSAGWYTEKAAIDLVGSTAASDTAGYFLVEAGSVVNNSALGATYGTVTNSFVGTAEEIGRYVIDVRNADQSETWTFAGSFANQSGAAYQIGAYSVESGNSVGVAAVNVVPVCPVEQDPTLVENGPTTPLGVSDATVLCATPTAFSARNPAHMIHEALTHAEMAGEPSGLIDETSFQAAADQLYLEGFGLCTTYDSAQEATWDYITRICSVIGAECTQSRLDGKYYLDLVRGGYDIGSLPILTEDDILEFKATPAGIETVNSVNVKWHDPIKNEDRTTSPVFALGRVQAAGEIIQQTKGYPEIPMESLALRAAKRDLDIASPTLQRHELTVRRKHRGLRPGQPFRLQLPSEGIADAVLRLGSVRHGTHRDGRVRMVAVQDVFNLPDTVVVQPSPGDWATPANVPIPPPAQAALEAPYVELAASLTAADLAAVADDAGFLLTAAALPSGGLNYAIATAAAGEEYVERATADFCPTALVVESAALEDPLPTAFTLSDGSMLDRVVVGSWALWGNEVVRVDAIDAGAGTCGLGRACADTVPQAHAAGDRIWFCGDWVGTDSREYVDADVVSARLLTRTTSGQLPQELAITSSVTMDQRQFRPYPPAQVRLNGEAFPVEVIGDLQVTFVPRDRLLQANQLLDFEAAGVGPEVGTTFTLELYDASAATLVYSEAGIATTPALIPASTLVFQNRLELYAMRDSVESQQRVVAEFISGLVIGGQLLGGALQESYASALTALNAVEPVTWSIVSGALPAGIVLNTISTAATVAVDGIPTGTGTFTVTIGAQDANGKTATREFTLSIGEIVSLLHFNGTDGSTTFTDAAGKVWTRSGNAQIDTAQSKFDGASGLFDGTGDFLKVLDPVDLRLTGDFTVDGWVRPVVNNSQHAIAAKRGTGTTQNDWEFDITDTGRARFLVWEASTTTAFIATGATVVTTGAWHHVAAVRSGARLLVFLDGVLEADIAAPAVPNTSIAPCYIARDSDTNVTRDFNGWIDELRMTTGARYTESFTPPAAPSDYPA